MNLRAILLFLFTMLINQHVVAMTGKFFNIVTTENSTHLSSTICLNGKGPITCQDYILSDWNFSITSTVPQHTYTTAGIKINTPGYTLTGCTMISNGFCLFATSDVLPANISVRSITSYSIGGTISGLIGTVVLQNNGSDTISANTDGSFTFPTGLAEGDSYAVTVLTQPAGLTCTVNNGFGTVGTSNVANVNVTCSENAYTVGGMVSGISGTVLLNKNGTDLTSVSTNGCFTFPTPMAEGSLYGVTVVEQPIGQVCTVNNGFGVVGGANVTNVSVICSSNAFTVGGTISGLNGNAILFNNTIDPTQVSANGDFTFSKSVAEGSQYNVAVFRNPPAQTCSVTNGSGTMGSSNVSNVQIVCATNATTISVSSTGVIPVNADSGSIAVTNTGTNTGYNIHASLPSGWLDVDQDASACAALAAGDTCQITFTSTTPYVAQGNIAITGDNVDLSPTTSLAFSVNDYLVWSVPSSSSVLVISDSDVSSSHLWSATANNIPGITTDSISPPDACNGATDGLCNTSQIVAYYLTPYTNYAAGLCYQITSDNSGTIPAGTWFLPSICEMGQSGGNANCSSGLANVSKNLFSLGFTDNLNPNALYWTSTESTLYPSTNAWTLRFSTQGQLAYSKNGNLNFVRCVKTITY